MESVWLARLSPDRSMDYESVTPRHAEPLTRLAILAGGRGSQRHLVDQLGEAGSTLGGQAAVIIPSDGRS